MTDGKAPKIDDLFALAYATIFDVVKLARKEQFWELSKQEASKLGKVTVGCINTIPEASKVKIVKRFDKYLPWISLVGFGAVITYPRIAASMENEKQKRSNRFPSSLPFSGPESPAESPLKGAPFVSEGLSTDTSANGNKRDSKSSFSPGHGANFPPLDFEIS